MPEPDFRLRFCLAGVYIHNLEIEAYGDPLFLQGNVRLPFRFHRFPRTSVLDSAQA
jgi:hypothetical protein